MIATVKAYYNTGLTLGNCMDSLNALDSLNFSTREFPNIAIKQDRGLINIRINTNYENIKDADYCKINNVGYWVTSIVMINDNVAEVQLQQDYLTTVGTVGLEVISGWCNRRHVLVDNEYENTIDEPFTPTNKLEIDFGNEIKGSGASGATRVIVVSSIDLANLEPVAIDYVDAAADKVLVPQLPVCSNSSTTYVSNISGTKQSKVPMTQAYAGGDSAILQALSKVRSLGVESCIVACYNLPSEWVSSSSSGSLYTQLTDAANTVSSAFNNTWGSYKNKKVYSGQFQKITIYSLASGESTENRVEDILGANNTIQWYVAADPRYNGNPICRPKYYHGTENTKLLSTINGAKWQQTPITYSGASGSDFLAAQREITLQRGAEAAGLGIFGGAIGMLGGSYKSYSNAMNYAGSSNSTDQYNTGMNAKQSNINPIGSALGIMNDISTYAYTYNSQMLDYNRRNIEVDVQFPRVPSFQDYVGNNFYELRYRLSDNDMTRFDNFLSAFGYAVDEILSTECFGGRTHFNYVKATDVSLKKNGCPQYLLDGAAKIIENGIRIWHTAPAHSKLINNPIS